MPASDRVNPHVRKNGANLTFMLLTLNNVLHKQRDTYSYPAFQMWKKKMHIKGPGLFLNAAVWVLQWLFVQIIWEDLA